VQLAEHLKWAKPAEHLKWAKPEEQAEKKALNSVAQNMANLKHAKLVKLAIWQYHHGQFPSRQFLDLK